MDIIRGIIGVIVLLAICWLLSNKRSAINWRVVVGGIVLQLILAILILKTGFSIVVKWISTAFVKVLEFSDQGAAFMFGDLLNIANYGIAFKVLPTIIFVSAITSVLYYLGILQWVVKGFAYIMMRFMRLSGAESLATAANVFVGQTEAPLIVRPYINKMTQSEIMALMTGGMATIAGSVFGVYMGIVAGDDPEAKSTIARYLLTASFMNAPAALLIAKMLVPERETVNEDFTLSKEKRGTNLLEALVNGTSEGLKLALNVAAMLIAFIAIMALINAGFKAVGSWGGTEEVGLINGFVNNISGGVFTELSLEAIFGFLFAPIAWVIGANPGDLLQMGQLLGTKMVANEFLAYQGLGVMKSAGSLDSKSIFLATFALCGFANFSSIGIQIGGIGALAPERRTDLAQLGLKAMIGGTLASLLTASIAGMCFAG